jgi:hypothetical protein
MQKKWPDEQRVKELADLFRLYFYLYTPPKRNIILDLPGSLLWGGIVPGGVFVLLAIYLNRIVAGQAFPRAGCVRIAPLKILVLDRIGREVLVPLYDYTGIAFSECDAVPGCFGHGIDVILFYFVYFRTGDRSYCHAGIFAEQAATNIMENKSKSLYIPIQESESNACNLNI